MIDPATVPVRSETETNTAEPAWVREGLAPLWHKVRPVLEVARGVIREPKIFARDWASGTRRLLNPLTLVASAATTVGLVDSLAHDLLGLPFKLSVWDYALRAISPYIYYAELGLLAHVALWLMGNHSRKATTAIALALYSGGTLATASMVILLVDLAAMRAWIGPHLIAGMRAAPGSEWVMVAPLLAASTLMMLCVGRFGMMLRELYQAKGWQLALTMVFTVVGSGLVASVAPLPTAQLAIGRHGGGLHYPAFAEFFDDPLEELHRNGLKKLPGE